MNRKKIATIIGLGAAALALGTYGFTYPFYVPAPPAHVAYVDMAGVRHPELDKALRNLQRAQQALQSASRDFHGHRAKALSLTNKAIDEVNRAIASDRN